MPFMLNANEESVLDALHFVSTFPELLGDSGLTDTELAATLKNLIVKKMIDILQWNEAEEDYLRIEPESDLGSFGEELISKFLVSNDSMQQYYFLASKKGLQALHHS